MLNSSSMPDLHHSHRPNSALSYVLSFNHHKNLLLLLIVFLFVSAFVLQWQGGSSNPIRTQLDNAGLLGSPSYVGRVKSDSNVTLGRSSSPVFPHFRGLKFDYNSDDSHLRPKVCMTTSTSGGLDQIEPWIYFHKVIGISKFFIFVEGKAATSNVSKVLESIPGNIVSLFIHIGMDNNNWWIHLLMNLFTCDSKSKSKPKPKSYKEKAKGWRWIFGRFMLKQVPKKTHPSSLSEAREEQRKLALNVAKATAVAAKAAVLSAQAAAEVVRLTCSSNPSLRKHDREIKCIMAVIKIQTAFRGYIARKALRALKGVVKLQAIVRGRAVRRRVKLLASNRHPRIIHARETNQSSKVECRSQSQWTDTQCSKEDVESMYVKRQDAVFRRARMKQYSFSHRERQYSYPRRQWTAEDKNASLNFHSSSRLTDLSMDFMIKPRNSVKKCEFEEEVSFPFSTPRRSFGHLRVKTGGDIVSSPSLMYPSYMATTESAKAKMRSMSTPRQRLGYFDTCFHQW